MPMSPERMRLIEVEEERVKAAKMLKRLEWCKEAASNTFAGAVVLALVLGVLYISIMPWFFGAGWFTILIFGGLGVVITWIGLKEKAEKKIKEANNAAAQVRWGKDYDRNDLDY